MSDPGVSMLCMLQHDDSALHQLYEGQQLSIPRQYRSSDGAAVSELAKKS